MPGALDLIPAALQTRVLSAALHGVFALPRPIKRIIAGGPLRLDGQELALDAQLLLRLQRFSGRTQLSAPTVELARTAMRQSTVAVATSKLSGVEVTERHVPTRDGGLAARLYRPMEGRATQLMVFFHGGGWVVGDLDSHDDFCRFLAKHAGIRVLSVDYRLAPEHPFPAALEDAIDAYRFAVENARELGVDGVSVGGDSAGGNLAAAVSLEVSRSELPPPAFQLLLYPATDGTARRRSRELFGDGFLLSNHDVDWFIDHYFAEVEQRNDPRLSVLLADDVRGAPPAYVVTAGFDPLRDDGEAYAQRLAEAGVPVVARRFSDLIHAFVSLRLPGTRFEEALFEVAGAVRMGLGLATPPDRPVDSRP